MVIEDCYSQLCKLDRVRPAMVADGLGQLQIRWPSVHVVFCETRQLAGEWTYRFLARSPRPGRPPNTLLCNASHPSRSTLPNLRRRPPRRYRPPRRFAPGAPSAGLPVPDRGRLGPEIWAAWHDGNPPNRPQRQGPPYCPPPPDRKAHRSHERGMHPLRSSTGPRFSLNRDAEELAHRAASRRYRTQAEYSEIEAGSKRAANWRLLRQVRPKPRDRY